jgi:molybdate/tungstate transport system ATP-binding protein
MNQPVHLSLQSLEIQLEDFHLRDISLDIYRGEFFVLLGPTGAGKSILLELLAGIREPDRGRLLMNGQDITRRPPEARRMSYVYQEYALFPHLDVRENIAFGLKLLSMEELSALQSEEKQPVQLPQTGWLAGRRRKRKEAITARVREISELLGIDHLLDRNPGSLSGGEKQRVALARSLVVQPRVLLLDEPLSALDPETSAGLQEEIARLQETLQITTIHITHDFEEAVALADRIGVLFDGKIVQVGSPREIFRKPADEQTARFVGVRNIFQGEISVNPHTEEALFRAGGLEIQVVSDQKGRSCASIRPEDIILSREPVLSSARNTFQGVIREVSDRGSYVYVTVDLTREEPGEPFRLVALITHRSLEEMNLHQGSDCWLAFKATAVHFF